MNSKQFEREYLNIPVLHDDDACNALAEYDALAEKFDRNNFEQLQGRYGNINGRKLHNHVVGTFPNMQEIANKYNTTIPEMKKHYRCIEH